MEKIMTLVSCSTKKTTKITRRDGTQRDYDFYEVKFTDGIDTIYGETSETMTNAIKSDGDDKLRMLEGHLYAVRAVISVQNYTKDNVEKSFMKATFFQISLLV